MHAPTQKQTDSNKLEEGLVRELITDLTEVVTDRSGDDHHHPWDPTQRVRIGVLRANRIYDDDSEDGNTDNSRGESGTAESSNDAGPAEGTVADLGTDITNNGIIGLDFVLAPEAGASTAQIRADIQFAIYQPIRPNLNELAAEAAAARQAAANVIAGAAKAGKKKTKRASISWRPGWRRIEVSVSVSVDVPLNEDSTGIQTSSDASDPLHHAVIAAVDAHFSGPDAARPLSTNQTLVAKDLHTASDVEALVDARTDATWTPEYPHPAITASGFITADGNVAVELSITNEKYHRDKPFQDYALYDTRMQISVIEGASVQSQQLQFAESDLRYAQIATVPGRGRGCVAAPVDDDPNSIRAETLPLHIQPVLAPAAVPGADVRYETLSDQTKAEQTLGAVAQAMRSFLRDWNNADIDDPSHRAQLDELRATFTRDTERFELGIDLIRYNTAEIGQAFTLANKTFAQADPDGQWRLFQLVFIVTELGGLAIREIPSDPILQAELETVDVLWFPTGGGKTEAYLGLIAVALFFDRLRGKARGHTGWLLFPLRMLSVQQLARVSTVLFHAEHVRCEHEIPGDPFSLGYLVGSGNTPNSLYWNNASSWWPGLGNFATWSADERRQRRLVGACPACGDQDSVNLVADTNNVRLRHVCDNSDCGHVLAIQASDEEVFRYASTIIVSTIDKIAALARNGELSGINRGPQKKCPAHGWYNFNKCRAYGCESDAKTHNAAAPFKDATPALFIQDELHLVREELGVFAAHYHSVCDELARGAGNLPWKVIAATATIEQFEDQLRQVYGRRPRLFPTGGKTLDASFYTSHTGDTRRIYLGVMPNGGGTAKVDLAGVFTAESIRLVHEHRQDPGALVGRLASAGIVTTRSDVVEKLFDYELVLAYVNAKSHAQNILGDVAGLSDELEADGHDRICKEYLSGESSIGELAHIVAAVESAQITDPLNDRYRALVGTSVVSHGVDLRRLDIEVLAGMPSSYAQYIQATARAGRSYCGLVIPVFSRVSRREASMFQSFLTFHAALERMVEPVPVNRYAARAVERTLPGIACALLWDEAFKPENSPPARGIGETADFKPWWNAQSANIEPTVRDRIRRAYTSIVPGVNPADADRKLANTAEQRWDDEQPHLNRFAEKKLTDLFSRSAMTSLRDVEVAAEFSAMPKSAELTLRMDV